MKNLATQKVIDLLHSYTDDGFTADGKHCNDTDNDMVELIKPRCSSQWSFEVTVVDNEIKNITETFDNPADYWVFKFSSLEEFEERLKEIQNY